MNKFAAFIMFTFGYFLGTFSRKDRNEKMESLIKEETINQNNNDMFL